MWLNSIRCFMIQANNKVVSAKQHNKWNKQTCSMKCVLSDHINHLPTFSFSLIFWTFNANNTILKILPGPLPFRWVMLSSMKLKNPESWKTKKTPKKIIQKNQSSHLKKKKKNSPFISNEKAWAESWPGAGPVLQHIRWTGRCSRCTSASSPAGPCSAGTTAGSEQLPL